MSVGTKTTVTSHVMPCSCVHEWQDSKYGKGMRLFKRVKREGRLSETLNRCTVCFSRPHKPGNGNLVIVLNHRYARIPANMFPIGPIRCG